MNYNLEKFFGISLIIILIVGTITIFSTQQVVNKYQYKQEVIFDPKKLFDRLADVQNYPKLFPRTFNSVKILNQTNDMIFTEETISYQGITRTIEVKHEIKPYKYHIITILSGELKNSSFVIKFNEKNPQILKINAEIYFPAYLALFVNSTPFDFNRNINNMFREMPNELKKELQSS